MTPTFSTLFKLLTKAVRVTDTFNYSGITASAIYGNVTAKIGNTIFHTNTNFNASADIVQGTNTYVDFDLPLNADGTIRETSYNFTYSVKIENEQIGTSSADVAADTFTTVTIPSNPTLAASINALIAAGVDCRARFNLGSTSGYAILSATATTIVIASTTISGAGAGLNAVTILSTSTSTSVTNYDFCDITPQTNLCVTSDCFFATVTAQDSTLYLANMTIASRALTINWPRLANGNPVDTAVVTSDASKTIGPNIYTGGYLVTLSTALTWTQTDGLLVSNTVQGRSDYVVDCSGNICSAFNCIKAYMVRYQQAVALGSRELTQFTQQNFQILLYCNLYNIAIECQKTSEARDILVALGEYMSVSGITVEGCDCGCTDSSTSSTEPTLITPLYNSATYNHATETAAGIAELATQAETNTGTDDTKIVTPLKLKTYVATQIVSASETVPGVIEIATQVETDTGTDDLRAITPLKLQNKVASESAKGIADIIGSSAALSIDINDPNLNNDTKIVTLKKLSLAISNILTRILVFTSKIFFQKGVNIVGNPSPVVEGDLYYDSGLYKGKNNVGSITLITNTDYATESNNGILAVASILETLAGIGDNKIITPLKLQNKILDPINTASGTGTVAFDGYNGVVSYSTPLAGNTSAFYTITNSFVTANSIIIWSLQHTVTSTETPIPCFYQVQAGIITFKLFNSGSVTATGLKIYFSILNPGV